MRCHYSCRSDAHVIARRKFLGGLGAGVVAGGLGVFAQPTIAQELAKKQRRVLIVNFHGGLSQLESWDPKPGTVTGGPFRAIPTSAPGIQICELLPHTAKQMHRLAIIRSMKTNEDDHGRGDYMMQTGRRQNPALDYPRLGAVMSKGLGAADGTTPGSILITPHGGGRGADAAYLGPKFASIVLGDGKPMANCAREGGLTPEHDAQRNALRRRLNDRFALRRRTAETDAFTYSYEQGLGLMERRDAFDVTKESEADQERYGKHDLGRHFLLARRLFENGVTVVQVSHSNYDSHHENFDFHIEQLGEFDRPFATLIADLADRGMLESTLVVALSEFGRTPKINATLGRDHWSAAWSVVLGGCGIKPGFVLGRTDAHGKAVEDHPVDHANVFHTCLRAVGLDSTDSFDVSGRKMPLADPASAAIEEILL